MRHYVKLILAIFVCLLGVYSFATVPSIINYQGKLCGADGKPVADGPYVMQFAIYGVQEGGVALWFEPNVSVQVKDGVFSVLLGNTKGIPTDIFNSPERYFGVTVGTDEEMTPRQRIASVPFAMESKSVSNGAITAEKVADGAVSTEKIANGAVTAVKVANGAITADKLAPNLLQSAIPIGAIIMWSGTVNNIPPGWALCNGQNETPDLRDKFIIGAGGQYAPKAAGGNVTHSHTVNNHDHEMNHTHGMSHDHTGSTNGASGGGVYSGDDTDPNYRASFLGHTHTFTTNVSRDQTDSTRNYTSGAAPGTTGSSNLPPYYALCFIIKI